MGCIHGITENSPKEQTMKILLTGAAGQLGEALRQQLPAGVELIATSPNGDVAAPILRGRRGIRMKGMAQGRGMPRSVQACALTALGASKRQR